MPGIEKSLIVLDSVAEGSNRGILQVDPRASVIVTLIFLGVMLSVPVTHIDMLLWFTLYPIIAAPLYGKTYTSVFLQSLIVLPIVVLIGIFNPLLDKTEVVIAWGVRITNGWLMFIGIVLRGLLSMQALLILIRSMGYIGLVRSLGRLGVPRFLTTQLLMVFRYIRVVIEEGLSMKAARDSRSFGRKRLSIRLWGVLIGQLFLRSVDRAERVHRAMLARGFSGDIPFYSTESQSWGSGSTLYIVGWTLIFVFLRLFNLSLLFVS